MAKGKGGYETLDGILVRPRREVFPQINDGEGARIDLLDAIQSDTTEKR